MRMFVPLPRASVVLLGVGWLVASCHTAEPSLDEASLSSTSSGASEESMNPAVGTTIGSGASTGVAGATTRSDPDSASGTSASLPTEEGTSGLGCTNGLASIDVALRGAIPASGTPMVIDLDTLTALPASELSWVEVRDGACTEVAFQIAGAESSRTLHWLLEPRTDDAQSRVFELIAVPTVGRAPSMTAQEENDVLMLRAEGRERLGYHYGIMPAPEGQDVRYERSGFIHPLLSPHGQVLTRIQPDDHYHHYGLWDAWTHVDYEGREVDFWNLTAGQGTVRFADVLAREEGPVFTGYTVRQEHVVFQAGGVDEVALDERQIVRVYQSVTPEAYIADITMEMECATESPFLILEYTYAGLGWRATGAWNGNNSTVLTSEGLTRPDADNSTARWYMVQGDIEGDHAGIVMMSHPQNHAHPEPLRVWPASEHEGNIFAMFAPTKSSDWLLEPGQTYTLRYRMFVFNGELDSAAAEQAWLNFGDPPVVTVH